MDVAALRSLAQPAPLPAVDLDPDLYALRRTFDPDFDAECARENGERLTEQQRRRLGLVLDASPERMAHVVYGCFDCGAIVAGPESTCRKCGNVHGGAAHHRAVPRG